MALISDPACHACNGGTDRHYHPFSEITAAGIMCDCGGSDWWITFGGIKPVLVSCGHCARSFNLSERLRRLTPLVPANAQPMPETVIGCGHCGSDRFTLQIGGRNSGRIICTACSEPVPGTP
jgi:hypothetical protein